MKQAGPVVIITGAAGGIGRALVDIVAADGVILVAMDLSGSGVLELAGGLGHPIWALNAMSREKTTLSRYTAASKRSLRKSIFVNNAAIGPAMAATVDTGFEAFRHVLAINLIGPFMMSAKRGGARGRLPAAAE